MTEQEKANKKEARRLINLPLSKRPDTVFATPPTGLKYRCYMVQLSDDVGVYAFKFAIATLTELPPI